MQFQIVNTLENLRSLIALGDGVQGIIAACINVYALQNRMSRMKQFCLLFLLLLVCGHAAGASLDASVNRTIVSSGESLTLTLVADGVTGQPDLSPLETDFEVLGTSTRREVTIVNGEMSDLQSWDVELMPQRTGQIVIPALQLEQVSSQPVEIEVVEGTVSTAAGKTRDTFIEIEVDNATPFVQSQVLYTVRFYSAIRINEADLTAPVSESLTIRRLGEDTGYFQQRNGRRYRVIERRYAMFPRESGTLVIPPTSLKLVVPDANDPSGGFFGRVSRVSVLSESIELDVRPRPESDAGSATQWWFASQAVELEAVWENSVTEFRVGEPITRRVTLTARGVTAEQLPELAAPDVDGLKIYRDKPELIEEPSADALNARRIDKYAVIPQRPGEIVLPAIRVAWFDTVAETYREAIIEAETIQVVGAGADESPNDNSAIAGDSDAIGVLPGSNFGQTDDSLSDDNATQTVSESGNSDSVPVVNTPISPGDRNRVGGFWKTLSLVLTVLWLLTAGIAAWVAWRWRRHYQTSQQVHANRDALNQSAKQAMHQLKKQVKSDAPLAHIAESILIWAQSRWPGDPPRSLQALAERYPSSESSVSGQLQQIEKQLYSAVTTAATPAGAAQKGAVNDSIHQLPELLESATVISPGAESNRESGIPERPWLALWAKSELSSENRLPEL